MFKIKIHATGSTGNAYTIEDSDQMILIDPGIRFKDLQRKTNFTLSKYDFCLVSHEHQDHCKAVADVARLGIPIVLSAGTMEALIKKAPKGSFILKFPDEEFSLKKWKVLPFDLDHDAKEPFGFLIQSPSGKKILYATDTNKISYNFTGVTHYIVECNYSEKLLEKNSKLHESTKIRIRQTHFALEDVKAFFLAQDLTKTEAIYLVHLSDQNSNEKRFIRDIKKATGVPVYSSLYP